MDTKLTTVLWLLLVSLCLVGCGTPETAALPENTAPAYTATAATKVIATTAAANAASSSPIPSATFTPVTSPSLRPSPTPRPAQEEQPRATPTAASPSPTSQTAGKENQPYGEIAFYDWDIYLIPADRSRQAKEAYVNHHDVMIDLMQGISWSPDGSSFAFAMTPWSDIYTYKLGSSDSVNLTKTTAYFEEYPAWSPNGKLIAFISDRRQVKGKYTSDLYTMRADGSKMSLLVECPGSCRHPEWAPDGKSLVYQMDKDLYIVELNDPKPVRLTQGGVNQYPAWSPDGQWIAFVRSVTADPPAFIYLARPDGTDLHALTGERLGPRQLSWSSDGKFIAFENFPPEGVNEWIGIRLLNVESGEILNVAAGVYTPSWRPFKPQPQAQPTAAVLVDCSDGWTRLKVGERARVSGKAGDTPNRVRSEPTTGGKQIGLLQPGEVFLLLEGPVCADGLIFWKIESDAIPGGWGWTAEGDGSQYWLEPE